MRDCSGGDQRPSPNSPIIRSVKNGFWRNGRAKPDHQGSVLVEHRTVTAWMDRRRGASERAGALTPRGGQRAGERRDTERAPTGSARRPYEPTPDTWRMSETWPEGAPGPVYEIGFGGQPVAKIWRDADDWRFVFHTHGEIATDFQEFFYVVRLLYDRIVAPETRERLETTLPAAAREAGVIPEGFTSLSEDYRRDPARRAARARPKGVAR